MVGQEGVLRTLVFAGHNLVVFEFAGPFFLASQLAPFRQGNVDGVIVIVTVNLSIGMVALMTWRNTAITAGAVLIIAAPVARVSHLLHGLA